MRRFYSNTTVPVTLTGTVTAGATSLSVSSTAGFPAVPFTISVERGTPNEEACLVTAVPSGTSFTVTRGFDGTTGKAHGNGVPVEHTTVAMDYDEANNHVNDVALHQGAPTGLIAPWAGAEVQVPTGWLACAGQAVSRITYSALHTLLKNVGGTNAYGWGGGDGSTTFNIPDLRGRVLLGIDNMNGSPANRVTAVAADTVGGSAGAETVALSSTEMPVHTHIQNAHTHIQDPHRHEQQVHSHSPQEGGFFRSWKYGGGGQVAGGPPSPSISDYNWSVTDERFPEIFFKTAFNQSTTAVNQNSGGGAAHSNMQPYAAIIYMVKA